MVKSDQKVVRKWEPKNTVVYLSSTRVYSYEVSEDCKPLCFTSGFKLSDINWKK